MISGMTEEETILANARLDVLMKCGEETLKIIDNDYENEIVRLQKQNNILHDEINDVRKAFNIIKKYDNKAYKTLINSKEYKVAKQLGLNSKQSILIELENILTGVK